jgi:hypothetical protein
MCGDLMESKPMSEDYRPVANRQRGPKRITRSKRPRLGPVKGFWSWSCNPLMLKAVIATARLIYEVLHIIFPRH